MYLPLPNINPQITYDGRQLMPIVPPAFQQPQWAGNHWVEFQRQWDTTGGPLALYNLTPSEGIVVAEAYAHLAALQKSHGLTFEDRVSAVAYLASLWFDKISFMGVTYPPQAVTS